MSKNFETKSKVYAAAGVTEYWVSTLKQRKLNGFRTPADEGYEFKQTLSEGTIALLSFNNIQVSVQRLLRSGLIN